MNNSKTNWLTVLFRLIRRFPLLSLLVLVIGVGGYGCSDNLLYQGEPKAVGWGMNTWFRTFRNHGFIVGYSDIRGNPLWVEYALKPVDESIPSLPRPTRFTTDSRAINRVKHNDYTKSGYDRGHNAPNYAMSHLYGKEGQLDSFLMTNISPQTPKLNRQFWQRLEAAEAKYFTKLADKVWVITGPVFTGSTERLSSSWRVEIPDAFYKIYITEAKANQPSKVLAFLVPQTVKGNESLAQFVTSIDNIEAQTGLDFFSDLDDTIENQLEASMEPQAWDLQAVSNLPSRYY
ncbi:MAG: endonuclease G, mitochondrial [Methylococcaceae bacterium NSP1-2]|nr:DNA/RNA non-specific endonuclease [Methylococcaceae bacterium]OYV16955.1 MAG: endonuclease G, mitochondrial [Methylococcaceae bacterium NSP1-2]